MVNAIVIAGRENQGKLREISDERWEAMIPIAGKPMLQWILDALAGAKEIDRIILVAPEADLKDRLQCRDLTYVAPQGGIIPNVRAGAALLPPGDQTLIVTSDVPLITSQTLDGFVAECRAAGPADLYYPVLERRTMEARYPSTKRTYAKLREGTYTGGNFFLIRAGIVEPVALVADKFVAARKSPLQMAGLMGWTFIIKLLLGWATIPELTRRAEAILGVTARVVDTQQAEIGIDVDKPSDFELATAELSKS